MDETTVQGASPSTVPNEPGDARNRVELGLRYAASALVILVVALGATGILGVRTGVASASDGIYLIEVLHTRVARAGLAAPFGLAISTGDGSDLPDEVTVRLDSSYLEAFDFQGLEPTPTRSFNSQGLTWWTFEVPAGEAMLRVRLDARLEPAVQSPRQGVVALEVPGQEALTVEVFTFVMP